jgi:hypothetical protein
MGLQPRKRVLAGGGDGGCEVCQARRVLGGCRVARRRLRRPRQTCGADLGQGGLDLVPA